MTDRRRSVGQTELRSHDRARMAALRGKMCPYYVVVVDEMMSGQLIVNLCVCDCVASIRGELMRYEVDKPAHLPLHILPDCMKRHKPVIQSWNPYLAGDISTHILHQYCHVSLTLVVT